MIFLQFLKCVKFEFSNYACGLLFLGTTQCLSVRSSVCPVSTNMVRFTSRKNQNHPRRTVSLSHRCILEVETIKHTDISIKNLIN